MISFGSGWEGDVEGYEKEVWMIRNDISRQYKGTLEGWTVPQTMTNFTRADGRLSRRQASLMHAP